MAVEKTKQYWSKGFNVNYAYIFIRSPHPSVNFILWNICFDVFNNPYFFCPPATQQNRRHQYVNVNPKYLIMIYVWCIHVYVCVCQCFHFHFWVFSCLFLSSFCIYDLRALTVRHSFEEPSSHSGYWYFNFILHFNFK